MESLLMAAAHAHLRGRLLRVFVSLRGGSRSQMSAWLVLSAGEDRSRPERHIIMAARFQTLRGEPNGPASNCSITNLMARG